MMIHETYSETSSITAKRISWAAVLAGVVVVLAVQLVFGMIGLGLGAFSVDPVNQANPFAGLGTESMIWFGVSSLLSLFAGGWVAGHLAGIPRKVDSTLHGVLSWGVASVAAFYIVTAAAGGMMSAASSALGGTAAALGKGLATVSSEAVKKGSEAVGLGSGDLSAIKSEIDQYVKGDGKSSRASDSDLVGIGERLLKSGGDLSDSDRDEVVGVITSRTDISRADANRAIDRWTTKIQEAKQKVDQVAAAADEKAREAGSKVAQATAGAAAWSSLILVLSGIAAAFGGFLAAPRMLPPASSSTETIPTPSENRPLRSA